MFNLFYGTGIPAAILVMSRDKPAARRGKVLLVEASREYREGSNQNYLREQDVEKIARTVREYKDVERYARVVPVEEIARNEYNLNITRYVETGGEQEAVDVATTLVKLREAEAMREAARARVEQFLVELGYGS